MNTATSLYEKYVFYHVDAHVKSSVVNTKLYNKLNTSYLVLNYSKDVLCYDDSSNSIYRSVIFSFPEKEVLCYSPPKSIKYDSFIEKYPEINESIIVNEMIEGVMVNLFYDNRIQNWQIATKKSIGGNYCHKQPGELETNITFIQMFLEAIKCSSTVKPFMTRLNANAVIELFPKQYCYSFVLQHPENKIVLQIKEPKIYLVGVYEFNENRVIEIPHNVYEEWPIFLNISDIIHFPRRFYETSYTDLFDRYCSKYTNHLNPGIMLKNVLTGDRAKILNPVYSNRRKSIRINPNMHYQFLCLNRINKIDNFLKYYPVCKKIFKKFKNEYDGFITSIHRAYIMKYIEKTHIGISDKYLMHVDRIHKQKYLPYINATTKKKIDKSIVVEYVEKMEPGELLYYLNYDNRQYSEPPQVYP